MILVGKSRVGHRASTGTASEVVMLPGILLTGGGANAYG